MFCEAEQGSKLNNREFYKNEAWTPSSLMSFDNFSHFAINELLILWTKWITEHNSSVNESILGSLIVEFVYSHKAQKSINIFFLFQILRKLLERKSWRILLFIR